MTIPLSCENCLSVLDFYSKRPVNEGKYWFCDDSCHKQWQQVLIRQNMTDIKAALKSTDEEANK